MMSICFQIEINWEQIEAKIEMEYQKERERPERSAAPSAAGTSAGAGGRSSIGHSRQSLKT